MPATLLVELLTEELPPKSLRILGEAFASALYFDLQQSGFVADGGAVAPFCTPRRLAASLTKVLERSPDAAREVQGPPVSAASQAIEGFARKSGVAVAALEKRKTSKGEVYVARVTSKGRALEDALAPLVEKSLKSLPVAKLMRWGAGASQFVRPVHGLVMLHGARAVPGSVLGVSAGSTTRGHRFLGAHSIALAGAEEYEKRLRDEGMVIADFAARRKEIEGLLKKEASRQKAGLGDYESLLDEVTALVELPSVYVGQFDAAYLAVPPECLILTMRQNQKYFPLFGADGKLLPKFLVVSNMRAKDPRRIVSGNERVVRPRLEDARFFFDQDRKTRLEARVPLLAKVVYQNKLGTQRDRVDRLKLLSGEIATQLGLDESHRELAERAADLSKADLLTGMVGEFPELQGIMGRYYAAHDGERAEVIEAIGDQYRLRSEARTPESLVSVCLFVADQLDTLVGFFAIGEAPTGEKDPFGLRRAAIGIINVFRLLIHSQNMVGRSVPDVRELISRSAHLFPKNIQANSKIEEVHSFILERCWHQLAASYPKESVEAVISISPKLHEIEQRLHAVEAFRKLSDAQSLASANKRIRNILRKSESTAGELDSNLLREPAEKELFNSVQKIEPKVQACMDAGDFEQSLTVTASLRNSVDAFFDKVMVNVDDTTLRANRHALLRRLESLMNRVADISKLAVEK